MVNSNVVTGTQPNRFLCTGNHIYSKSRTSVATSGSGGMNYGKEMKIVKKQKMQGKNGVTVLQNLVIW